MDLDYQENAEVFSAVVEGIPRLVELMATLPPEKYRIALLAAQQSYLQTARTLGYRETQAQQWASIIISMLENAMWQKSISSFNSEKLKKAAS
jgi:hypothetical protein